MSLILQQLTEKVLSRFADDEPEKSHYALCIEVNHSVWLDLSLNTRDHLRATVKPLLERNPKADRDKLYTEFEWHTLAFEFPEIIAERYNDVWEPIWAPCAEEIQQRISEECQDTAKEAMIHIESTGQTIGPMTISDETPPTQQRFDAMLESIAKQLSTSKTLKLSRDSDFEVRVIHNYD